MCFNTFVCQKCCIGGCEGWEPWGEPGALGCLWSEWPVSLPLICVLVLVSKSSSGAEDPSAAASSPGARVRQSMLSEGFGVCAPCCPVLAQICVSLTGRSGRALE